MKKENILLLSATLLSIASLLSCLHGDVEIGMMWVCVSMMFVAIALYVKKKRGSEGKKGNSNESAPN